MKMRKGFVSNSSSSSFMIHLEDLRADQYNKIMDNDYSNDPGFDEYDRWSLETRRSMIIGSVSMDNYDMHYFLTEIVGIDENIIEWDEFDNWSGRDDWKKCTCVSACSCED